MNKAIAIIGAGVLALAGGVLYSAWPMLSHMPDTAAPITAAPLRGAAYRLTGGIATTGFVVGDTGLIAIDAQMFQGTAQNAQAAMAKVSRRPVNYLILTHSDPDHVNGLPYYPAGIRVIAQTIVRREIIEASRHWVPSPAKPPKEIASYLPKQLVGHAADVVLDGVPMHLRHFGPAHTDGDLIVFLPRERLVFAGDILTPEIGAFPGIHLEKGGSSLGWIRFVEAMLKLNADLFVSGHGQPLGRAEVVRRLAVAKQRRAEIAAMVAQGKSLRGIKAALHDQPLPGVAAMFPTFIETTYQELTR